MAARDKRGQVRIGTSGYEYDHWREVFYPDDIPKKSWFGHYARHFPAVEINNSFYKLPSEETIKHWREQAPPGFQYVLKYNRYGSHNKRLKDAADHIAVFMDRVGALGPTFGPTLVQLPPRWKPDPERLDGFLAATPPDRRWAVEVRDERWLCEPVFEVLRRHGAPLVVHDMIADHPDLVTADWVYLRFHGPQGNYAHSYSPQKLAAVAKRVREHRDAGRDVYAFFNNDAEGHAVRNALRLARYVDSGGDSEG